MKLRLETHHLPAILLLSAASLLVLKIGTELARDEQSNPPLSLQKNQNTHDLTQDLLPEFSLPPMENSYNALVARPLFTPSRRPPAVASDAALPSSMRKGQFVLLGVIITGDKKIAMLREIATSKVLNVAQGNEINGIQLEKLEPERITLKQGEEREELPLKIQPVARQQLPDEPRGNNAATPAQAQAQAQAQAAAANGSAQAARRPASDAMQELIARRRASHGLPPK